MKKLILIIGLGFIWISGIAQAVMIVKDNNKINQMKSIEYMQWKFTPKWYYYSWYEEKVLGIEIPMPGLGLHQHYINTYGNNNKQYIPAIASATYSRRQAEKEEADTKTVYNQELAKYVDREIDYVYSMTAPRREELKTDFLNYYDKYASDNSTETNKTQNCQTLMFEYDRILVNVQIINESHMSNAKKRESYLACEKELGELVALTTRLVNLNNILKKGQK
jgi:hypothetical protein